ncbi:unnamed protein product [Angiostrongylus costaricensis]|uniref:DNA polymerase alpha subunit B n=1 Tax=Angiostrongylus costaricensis TaxID=334426 RepID=A0A0R3PQA6_ANGCS|nr:unnamed protein product [Angiostrongylus costaricensis]
MVYIDYGVIAQSLSEFGYFMPESDALIDKVNSLATEFNLSVDDFVDELLASAVNMKRSEIDLGILEHMEARLSKKLKKSLDRVLTPSSSKSKRTFGERNVDESSLSVSSMDVDTSTHENFGSTQLTGKYRAFAPVASSPSNAKYQARMERNVVVREVQGQMFVSSSAVGSSIRITILSVMPSHLYALDKAPNVIDAKCGRLASFAARCRQANSEISSWSIPVPGSSSSEHVYGEIVRDLSEDLPLSDQCVSLMMDDEAGTVIKLDLSRLPEVVALLGSFENGDRFMATRQFFPNALPLSTFERTANEENLRLWCACGPFTSNENCSYEQLCDLLDMVKQQQPNVLVLRLHSVPEPCVVRINGVELALTSSEIISHLSKSEWHRSEDQENRDRIARLASHILEQGSLYPLFPPALPTSIEECVKVCSLRSAPHVIVCPSVLASFIKTINKTLIVNPGIAARGATGTFLRCEFATSIVEDVTNLADGSRFEIVRF